MKNKKVKQMVCDVMNLIEGHDSRVFRVEGGEIISYLIYNGVAGDIDYGLEGLAWIGGTVSLIAEEMKR